MKITTSYPCPYCPKCFKDDVRLNHHISLAPKCNCQFHLDIKAQQKSKRAESAGSTDAAIDNLPLDDWYSDNDDWPQEDGAFGLGDGGIADDEDGAGEGDDDLLDKSTHESAYVEEGDEPTVYGHGRTTYENIMLDQIRAGQPVLAPFKSRRDWLHFQRIGQSKMTTDDIEKYLKIENVSFRQFKTNESSFKMSPTISNSL